MPRPKKSDAAKAVQAPPAPVMPAMAPSPYPAPPPMPQQPLQPFQQFQPATPQFGGPPPPMPAPRTVDVEQFTRVRDSVHVRFNTILGLMKSFSDDFLRQTNLLLGEPTPFDSTTGNAMSAMVANLDGLSGQLNDLVGGPFEEKKERKKRTHDPNAPKRPLTPYFLYMQTARPIIAKDLGEAAPKGAVQEEGQRRWAAMSPNDKVAWNNAYQFNLRLYNARVHSYKNGNPEAREMTDQEAHLYADQNNIPQPALSSEDAVIPGNDQDAVNEQLGLAAVPAPTVPAPASPEENKTPKPKAGGRKRKSAAADLAEEGEASAAKVSTPANTEKKRKRQSKVAETPVEEPKKSARKKKST